MFQNLYINGKLEKCLVTHIEYEQSTGYYIVYLKNKLQEYYVRVWKGLEEEWDDLLDRWIFYKNIKIV